jgi:hypothetical protein
MPEQVAMMVASQVVSSVLFDDGSSNIQQTEEAAQLVQDRADEMVTLWRDYYQAIEQEVLTEVQNTPVFLPQYDAAWMRANAEALKVFAKKRKDALFCIPPRCEGMRRYVALEMGFAQARAVAHATSAARTAEETKIHIKNSQRLTNRIMVDQLGRNVAFRSDSALMAAAQLHKMAADRAQSSFSVAQQALGGLVRRGTSAFMANQAAATAESNRMMAQESFRAAEYADAAAPADTVEAGADWYDAAPAVDIAPVAVPDAAPAMDWYL